MKWVVWGLVLTLSGVVLTTLAVTYEGESKANRAVVRAHSLLVACDSHRAMPESGDRYPASLKELAKPPFGGSSFLRHPEEDLLDPWGNPFKYAVIQTDDGEPEVYVWAERAVDGKTRLIGAKLVAGGGVRFFGQE